MKPAWKIPYGATSTAIFGLVLIAIFWLAAVSLRPTLGVYAIPTALAIAQAHSFAWYWTSGRRTLGRRGALPEGALPVA